MSYYGYTKTCWLYACFSLFLITHYNEHFTSFQCTGSASFGCSLTPLTWLIIWPLLDQVKEKTAQNSSTQSCSLYDNIYCIHNTASILFASTPIWSIANAPSFMGFIYSSHLLSAGVVHAPAETLSLVQPWLVPRTNKCVKMVVIRTRAAVNIYSSLHNIIFINTWSHKIQNPVCNTNLSFHWKSFISTIYSCFNILSNVISVIIFSTAAPDSCFFSTHFTATTSLGPFC